MLLLGLVLAGTSFAPTGGTESLALAVTALTFVGLVVISIVVTADKRRRSPER